MIDYVNTVIYKLCCKNEKIKQCYVGHTTNLKQRKNEHRWACTNENNKKNNTYLYAFIRSNGGFDNWDMIEIEKFPCASKQEAHMRENYYFFLLKAELNTICPILNLEKKIIMENRRKIIIELKSFFNKATRKAARIKYLEDTADERKKKHTEQRRKYILNNREHVNARMREYNQITKERRSEQAKTYYQQRKAKGYYIDKIQCECGATIVRGNKSTHLKSKTHADLLAAQQNINTY